MYVLTEDSRALQMDASDSGHTATFTGMTGYAAEGAPLVKKYLEHECCMGILTGEANQVGLTEPDCKAACSFTQGCNCISYNVHARECFFLHYCPFSNCLSINDNLGMRLEEQSGGASAMQSETSARRSEWSASAYNTTLNTFMYSQDISSWQYRYKNDVADALDLYNIDVDNNTRSAPDET